MNRLVAFLAGAVLVVPSLAMSAERTGLVVADGIELTVPLPDGYVQSSVDVPDWLARMQEITPRSFPRPVESLLAVECLDVEDVSAYCRTAYDISYAPRRFTAASWPATRAMLVEAIQERSSEVIDLAISRRKEHQAQLGIKAELTLDTKAPVVLLAPDDLRGVRFRLGEVAVIREGEFEVRLWRFGGQMMVRGRLFNVTVSRELAEEDDAEAVAAEMEAELDAFLIRLYALNPMYEER